MAKGGGSGGSTGRGSGRGGGGNGPAVRSGATTPNIDTLPAREHGLQRSTPPKVNLKGKLANQVD